ncbi:MAG: 16S rRNA (guanine(966)-N(2))-methyltransferase RsmD [Nitriliruptoraceae bacterium]
MTRVIGGFARGRQLAVPAGDVVRPTGDRVKEALFSAIADHTVGSSVVDLYAGSGGLGLEALSRGARHVTFVEHSARVIEVLRANLGNVMQHCPDPDRVTATVVSGDVLHALARSIAKGPFTLAIADPPYHLSNQRVSAMLRRLSSQLAAGALVVVERPASSEAFVWPDNFGDERARRYGDTTVHRAELQATSRS